MSLMQRNEFKAVEPPAPPASAALFCMFFALAVRVCLRALEPAQKKGSRMSLEIWLHFK